MGDPGTAGFLYLLLALLASCGGGRAGVEVDAGPIPDREVRFAEAGAEITGQDAPLGDTPGGADVRADALAEALVEGPPADPGRQPDLPPTETETPDGSVHEAGLSDTTPADTTPPDTTPPDAALPDTVAEPAVHRVVLAGDSWSASAIQPLIGALPDWGYPDVAVSWELTAIGGSTAAQWASNEGSKLDALTVALLQDPPAEILLLFLGGNDLNGEIADGFFDLPTFLQGWILDGIREDLWAVVEFAQTVRPGLQVVLVDYDYLHLPFLQLYLPFEGVEVEEFNLAFVALGQRKREIAGGTPGCFYAHDFGILQHTLGDQVTPPFLLPPFDYPPGFAPKPGFAPDYEPFPGGIPALPSPLAAYPDGIHPEPGAMRIILDNVFEQGLDNLLEGNPWVP